MSNSSRRDFLLKGAALAASPLILPSLTFAESSPVIAAPNNAARAVQDQWRYCDKCHSMFYNGFPTKGKCPRGGAHNAYGYMFHLQYDLPENPKAQSAWRFCQKCMSMFWNGQPNKGRCAAGGGHEAQGYQFLLAHDIIPDNNNQDKWRFCDKCRIMFYDVSSPQGSCAAGGTHNAQGYMFVLPHDLPGEYRTGARLNTDGWAPIAGNMDIVVKPNGDYAFTGHLHNSGGLNIRFSLAATVTTGTGQAFGFAVTGKRIDGTETVFGRNRNHDWSIGGNDPKLAQYFAHLPAARLDWRLVASATISETIQNYLQNLAKEGFMKMLNVAQNAPGMKVAQFYLNLVKAI
ncbi:MAG: hypothetical protein QM785_15800 [Pyrinomonadaceae bacterium]